MYSKFQRDNIIRVAIETAKGCADRVGIATEVSNNANGDVVLVFKNPRLGELE